jgi:hypothetical protein
MSKFNLSTGVTDYQLDIEGSVFDANEQFIGKWTTDKENSIAISKENGDKEKINVCWKFNDDNQFCLLDAQQNEVFNFHSIDNNRPKCDLRDAVLRVKPQSNHNFQFKVRGEWLLNEKHQLEFTCNEVTSILDGMLFDKKSRFIYRLRDKKNPRINYRLGFAGKWEQFMEEEGVPRLKFHYQKETDELGVFEMPKDGKLIVQNGINQFRYVYDKENKTFGITLLGFLKIKENLEIVYTIDKQSANNGDELIAKTTFALQAAFSGNQFDGDLGLVILKDDNTPGNYKLTVTGDYTGVIGATQVMVGFRFSQRRKRRLVTTVFGIGGAFIWDNGQVSYAFDVGGGIVELELGLDIRLRNGGDINSKFSFVGEDGQIRTISFLFGITF